MLLNGNMLVSQESGTSFVVTPVNTTRYIVDNWAMLWTHSGAAFSSGQSIIASSGPLNIPSYLSIQATTGITSAVAASDLVIISQAIEGLRAQALGWGTSAAQPVTIGLIVGAQVNGTMSIAVRNGALNRSYVTNASILSGQWNYITFTVPGDAAGTWALDNSAAVYISTCFCCGTTYQAPSANTWVSGNFLGTASTSNFYPANGNTVWMSGAFMLPGTKGPTQTDWPFIYRPFQTELEMCQRYYEKSFSYGTLPATNTGVSAGAITGAQSAAASTSQAIPGVIFKVTKRATPTITIYNPNAANNQPRSGGGTDWSAAATSFIGDSGFGISATSPAGSSPGVFVFYHFTADARI
jgi:hypothetical protein